MSLLKDNTKEDIDNGDGRHSRLAHHPTIDCIHALLRWDDHVENEKVALEAVRHVIFPGPRVIHCAHVLQIFDDLQVIKKGTKPVILRGESGL